MTPGHYLANRQTVVSLLCRSHLGRLGLWPTDALRYSLASAQIGYISGVGSFCVNMKYYPNKFAGKCQVCHRWQAVGLGYIAKVDDKWVTYCPAHIPTVFVPRQGRVLSADGCIHTPSYEPENLDLFRSMPGARWDGPNKCWNVSLAIGDRVRLLELADRLKLQVAPELRKVEASEQANNAHLAGLYHFQVGGVDWLSKRDKALLGDDMGLGKTIEALVAFPKNAAALVVCPSNVKYNWAAECRKWRPDLKLVVLSGRAKTVSKVLAVMKKAAEKAGLVFDRKQARQQAEEEVKAANEAAAKRLFRFPAAGEVVIVNFDVLPEWLEPKKVNEKGPAWDIEVKLPLATREAARKVILVVDEVHRCKNHETARAKRVKGLALVCGKVWGLTGTLLENWPMDLWGTLSCLGFAHIVFGKFTNFVERMHGVKNKWGGYEWGQPDTIVPELLRRVMLRRKREEVLPDLPGKVYHSVTCDLPDNLRNDLDRAWDLWGEYIQEKQELPPFEDFSTIRQRLAASRIPALLEMVEDCEAANCPLVVGSAHLEPIKALSKRDGWAVITGETPSNKRQQIVEDFQAGKLKGVGLTIKAGGLGLTLTRAWKVVEVDLDWVPSVNEQFEDRLCRIGQDRKVEVVRLVSDHILDQHVLRLIARKMNIIEKALEGHTQGLVQVIGQLVNEAVVSGIGMSEGYKQRVAETIGETREQFETRLGEVKAYADAFNV
jgi:hypothetical protein